MSDWSNHFKESNRSLFQQAINNRILVEQIINETPKEGSVLEAGCGTAYLSCLLADMNFKVTAGDIDEDVLSDAARRYSVPHNPVKFLKADLFKLDEQFTNDSFDTICHSGVLEHFSDEMIVETLKQQKTIAKKVVFKIPNSKTKMSASHFGDERFLKNSKWVELIGKAGFSTIKVVGGESTPKLSYLLPYVFMTYPKIGRGHFVNKIAKIGAIYRKLFSRHTIFVCGR